MENTSSHKKIIWLLWSAVVIIVVAAVVAVVLKQALPQKSAQSAATSASASDVITAYTKQDAIKSYDAGYHLDNVANQPVYYQLQSKSYGVEIQSSHNATYTVAAKHADQTQAIIAQTTGLLAQQGLKQQTAANPSANATGRITYSNGKTVCQFSSQAPGQYAGAYSLTCVDNHAVINEYSATAQLASLYENAAHVSPHFTEIDRIRLVTDGNKSLAVVVFSTGDTSSQQLFAAIDNKWEFIVTLSDSSSKSTITNGKYSTSPAVESALNNPKYGDFLKNNIG